MFILLESSDKLLCVGISKDGELIDGTSYEAWQSQSEYMISEIDKLLTKNNVSKSDINGVVVSIGPGSYTGIRIALTIAKVTALACNAKLFALSSLELLRKNDEPSICLMDARSKRSYIGVYKGDEVILKDQIMSNEDVKEYIKTHNDFIICGHTSYLGIDGYKADVLSNMIKIATEVGAVDNPLAVKPVYLKDDYDISKK